MVGGSQTHFEQALPYMKTYAAEVTRMGGPGTGQHTKMANQIMAASTFVGIAESLKYAEESGIDTDHFLKVANKCEGSSFLFEKRGPPMLKRDFTPAFTVDNYEKDLRIASESAQKMDLQLPGLQLSHKQYNTLKL